MKKIVLAIVAVIVVIALVGNDEEAAATPAQQPVATVSEAEVFSLAIEMTLDDTAPSDMALMCDAADTFGWDFVLDAMREGYGDGYWDGAVVRRLFEERCP